MTRCRRIERAAIARDCRMSGLGFTAASRVSSDRRRRIRHVVNRARERQQLSGDCTCLTLATARSTTDRNVFKRATTTNTRVARQIVRKARWAYYNCDTSTIRLQHATTRYEVFRALAYEIDSSTPRESVVGVCCMLIDSSMHTIFTLYLYRPTLHRVCEYARNCLYKRN